MSYQGPPPAYPGSDQSGYQQAGQPGAYAVPVPMAPGGYAPQPVAYGQQPVAYGQPVAYAVPVTSGTGLLQASYMAEAPIPVASAISLPGASEVPNYEMGSESKYRDVWAGALFWVHFIAIAGVAFALGPSAINADASRVQDDPNASALRINAWTVCQVVLISCAVSCAVSAAAFALLKRAGGAMIRIALWVNFFVLAAMAAVLAIVALPAGLVIAVPAVLTLVYIRCISNRIKFAAVHLQAACDALQGTPIFGAALLMLGVQTVWNGLWSLAAVGVNAKLAGNGTAVSNSTLTFEQPARMLLLAATATPIPDAVGAAALGATNASSGQVTSGEQSGALAVFLMLLSFYWGSQVFSNVMTFVSATVVRHWWFGPEPSGGSKSPVWLGLKRAFTTSFGSIAFGSLIVAFLRALEAMARSAERNAKKDGNAGAAFAAACLLCALQCVRKLAEYFNQWAYIICALTGRSFVASGKEAKRMFMDRGWTAIINDDLVGLALGLSNIMVASVSTAIGAGLVYFLNAANPNRVLMAALAGVFSFVIGVASSAIMNSTITAATRAVFVCFALNPAALADRHPQVLASFAQAWAEMHPSAWQSSGYAMLYPSAGPAFLVAKV